MPPRGKCAPSSMKDTETFVAAYREAAEGVLPVSHIYDISCCVDEDSEEV